MPFCTNCGQEVAGWAKFCPNCGTPSSGTETQEARRQAYAGEIRKCPNCGEPLSAFEVSCHACGFELHNTAASTAVQRLANEISRIEADRIDYVKDQDSKWRLGKKEEVSPIDKSIANVIRTFAVPNTKEDILEFLMLAASSIEMDLLEHNPNASAEEKSRRLISEAWITKFEQTYQKAKISFGKSPDFIEIKEFYEKKKAEIHKGKTKSTRQALWILAIYVVFMIIVLTFIHFSSNNDRDSSSRSSPPKQETYNLQDGLKETKDAVNEAMGLYKDVLDEYIEIFKPTP